MRQSAGYTSKSSISHTLTRDTRDDALQGTRGPIYVIPRALGGDMYVGTIKDLKRTDSMTARLPPLTDIFSLWAHRFANVRPNEMGPRDRNDSVGGDMYWAVGASIIGPFPRKPDWPLKTHLFINAGRLDTYDTKKSSLEQTARSLSTPSISAGIGLVYMLNPVRVELNFGVPIAASVSDGMRKGVQVGIGMDFL
ncbi:Surface antigen [Rhizoctonia solani]|uniref:Surface antigen n=1 Tax=Rhizoctonia solani TaxID=456999 RepID=A0A8H7IDY2_9AGAM|nr:Surface antigen [Rhizoctonia solani]